MKIGNHTTLLEMQTYLRDRRMSMTCSYVSIAACFRVLVIGPAKGDAYDEQMPVSIFGIGRDFGEAVANALKNYDEAVS